MADVAADVMAIIANKRRAGTSAIALTDRLEDLGIESLDAVEMIFELEEKFDMEFETVGDVVKAVDGLINGQA
jgi:acyl carrier protein